MCESPRGSQGTWEFLGAENTQGSEGGSPWCSQSPSLASWSLEACLHTPLSQAHRTQAVLPHSGAGRETSRLLGLGSGSPSFIHSFVHPTSVQAPTVCQSLFSVLGILLRLGRTHTALFPMLVVSTLGWGSLGSQGRLLSLCAHAHWA